MVPIDKDDLEGPKIDRRTTMKILGAAGLSATSAMAGCSGSSGSGDGTGTGSEQNTSDNQGDSNATSTNSSGNQSSSNPQAAQTGGSIEVGWLTDVIEFLDPHLVDVGAEVQVMSNIQSGILRLNQNSEIVGDAAKDWTIPDNTTYEFTLREGMTFHNGDPLDAEAVKWSLERLRGLDKSPHKGKVTSIESIETDGETTVTINLSEPTSPFLAFMTRGPGRAGAIVNRTAVESDPDEYNYMPIGSGPFEITDRSDGQSLTLQKYDNYWKSDDNEKSLPYLDEVRIRLIPELSTMWSALQSDSIQFANQLFGNFANQAEKSDQVNAKPSNAGEWNVIAMLSQDPAEIPEAARGISGNSEVTQKWQDRDLPTSDVKVRQAIAMAINRQELVKRAYFDWAEPAHTLVNPTINWAYKENPEWGQQQNVERARELLDEAGYTGDPRFSANILALQDDQRELTVVQDQLSKVGIDLKLNITQASAYWPATYEYENMMVAYGGASDIDPWMSFYKQLGSYDSELGRGVWQRALWFDDKFDELLAESLSTPEFEEREPVVDKLAKRVAEQAPFATTTFPFNPKASVSSLSNVGVPVGLSNFHRAYLED